MDLNYFIKKPHTELTESIKDFKDLKILNPTVIEINYIDYDVDLDFFKDIYSLNVKGVINFSLKVKDPFSLLETDYVSSIDWDEEYFFNDTADDKNDLIIENSFDIKKYILEQININLPYNLINNNDIIKKNFSDDTFMTEEEYVQNQQNRLDPKWEKLDKLKTNK